MAFEDCWKRTREVTGMKTQTELAAFLNIKSGPVSDAKRRGVFPLEWAFKIAQHYGVSSDWIITGEHPSRKAGKTASGNVEMVREEVSGFTTKEKISILQKKLNFIMENGNLGQQKTITRTIDELYDEVFLDTD